MLHCFINIIWEDIKIKIIINDGSSLDNRSKLNYNGFDERSQLNYCSIDERSVKDERNLVKNRENITINDTNIYPQKDETEIGFSNQDYVHVTDEEKVKEQIDEKQDDNSNKVTELMKKNFMSFFGFDKLFNF